MLGHHYIQAQLNIHSFASIQWESWLMCDVIMTKQLKYYIFENCMNIGYTYMNIQKVRFSQIEREG